MRFKAGMAWLLAPLLLIHSAFYGFVLDISPSQGVQIRIESSGEADPRETGKQVFTDVHRDSLRQLDLSALDEFPPIAGLAELPAAAIQWVYLPALLTAEQHSSRPYTVVPIGSPPASLLFPRLSSVVLRV